MLHDVRDGERGRSAHVRLACIVLTTAALRIPEAEGSHEALKKPA